MPDIHIHRKHQLGLAKAREIAWQWAEEVEKKFDMECTVHEGETEDTVSFKRIGVSGSLAVGQAHFELDAKLGFLLGAFSKTIESEIERNLDKLLADHAKSPSAKGKPAPAASAKVADKAAAKAATAKPATAKKARKPG